MTRPRWVSAPLVFSLIFIGSGLLLGLGIFGSGFWVGFLEAWSSTALDIEEVLSGIGRTGISCMSWLLMSSSLSILSISLFWIVFLGGEACLGGSGGSILPITVTSDFGSSLLLVWESLGVGMVAFTRGVLSARSSLLLCMSLGVAG